ASSSPASATCAAARGRGRGASCTSTPFSLNRPSTSSICSGPWASGRTPFTSSTVTQPRRFPSTSNRSSRRDIGAGPARAATPPGSASAAGEGGGAARRAREVEEPRRRGRPVRPGAGDVDIGGSSRSTHQGLRSRLRRRGGGGTRPLGAGPKALGALAFLELSLLLREEVLGPVEGPLAEAPGGGALRLHQAPLTQPQNRIVDCPLRLD